MSTYGRTVYKAPDTAYYPGALGVFVILGVLTTIQSLKIYSILHKIEAKLDNENYFINHYSMGFAVFEKSIRLLLTLSIILATKVRLWDWLQQLLERIRHVLVSYHLTVKENIDMMSLRESEAFISALVAVYIILLIWDLLGTGAMYCLKKKTTDTVPNFKEVDQTWQDHICIKKTGRGYSRSPRFYERLLGLFTVLAAIVCIESLFHGVITIIVLALAFFYGLRVYWNEENFWFLFNPLERVTNMFSKEGRWVGYIVNIVGLATIIFLASIDILATSTTSRGGASNNISATTNLTAVDKEESKSTPVTPPTLILATSKNLWCALPLIAIKNGYFSAHGINVTPTYTPAGRSNMDTLISDSSEFASVVEVNLAYLALSASADVKIVGTIVESRDFAIVARRSAGISKIGDLMKKRLAYSPGTGGEFFARNFLLRHKISESKVKIAKIQPLALQDAIVEHAVDAVATWEPFVTNINSGLGSDATIFRDPASYTGFMNIAVRNSWSEQHSGEIQAFLLALRDAHDFLRTNQATAQKMLAELIPLPLEVVVATWDLFNFSLKFDLQKQVDVTRSVAKLALASDSSLSGLTLPDYRRYFDDQYFKAIESAESVR